MPKSKSRKSHKKKVDARRVNKAQETLKAERSKQEFVENLIKDEQNKGLFDDTVDMSSINGVIL
jgi:hypothetical protein